MNYDACNLLLGIRQAPCAALRTDTYPNRSMHGSIVKATWVDGSETRNLSTNCGVRTIQSHPHLWLLNARNIMSHLAITPYLFIQSSPSAADNFENGLYSGSLVIYILILHPLRMTRLGAWAMLCAAHSDGEIGRL